MKIVIAYGKDVNYVTFETKVENPWAVLHQAAQDCPSILELPVKFTKKIPSHVEAYVLWEMNGNSPSVKQTLDAKEAIRFLKPKKPLRTLRELLEKYASASK